MAAQAAINRLPSFLKLISNSSDALDKPDLEDSGSLTIAMTKQLGANLAGDQPSMEQINKEGKRYSALAAGDLFTLFLDEDQSQESTTLTNKKRRAYHPIPKNHDWAELPEDALSIIFQKLGFFEVLVSAQQVCRSWRQVALDPSALCWRCIDMRCLPDVDSQCHDVTSCLIKHDNFTKLAIDRSGGHVEELCLMSVTDDLLTCIANRTPRLRCCTLIWCYQTKPEGLFNFFSHCPLLEELHVYQCLFSHESYKCVGLACPQLKCLHIDGILRKQEFHWDSEDEYDDLYCVRRKYPDFDLEFGLYGSSDSDSDSEHEPALNSIVAGDRVALEIADNMRQLRDLHLIRNFNLTNKGVHAILDKCLHLESLNISCCFDVRVDEALLVKLTKIKSVRLSRRSQYRQQCN